MDKIVYVNKSGEYTVVPAHITMTPEWSKVRGITSFEDISYCFNDIITQLEEQWEEV